MKVEPDIQDGPAGTGRPGQWWIASLVSLVVFSSLGFVFGVTARDGLASYFWLVCGFFIGATLCVLFATISFARNETHRVWAVIPALGLLLWGLSKLAQQWQSAHDFKVYSAYIEQLEADPEIALREHWPATQTTIQSRALSDAIWAPYVQFSASQVERIYAEMPPLRYAVFKQASCTPEFISAHFQEAFDLARTGSYHMLTNIVHHPNTPIELVQEVVFFQKQLPFEPPYQAGLILHIREMDVPTDPRVVLRPYEREAEGKFFVLTLYGRDFRTVNGGRSRQFPREVNSYVPGVPPDFDVSQLGRNELIFLPGLYEEYSDVKKEQLRMAEAFALEHNQRVLQQRTTK